MKDVCLFVCLWDSDVWELLSGVLEMSLDVLADDGLLVAAVHVVPFDAVLQIQQQK